MFVVLFVSTGSMADKKWLIPIVRDELPPEEKRQAVKPPLTPLKPKELPRKEHTRVTKSCNQIITGVMADHVRDELPPEEKQQAVKQPLNPLEQQALPQKEGNTARVKCNKIGSRGSTPQS